LRWRSHQPSLVERGPARYGAGRWGPLLHDRQACRERAGE
jgi:hypothetical protein